jgi:hypothetical protein
MTYRRAAGSCSNGPCPTIYVDDQTGDVLVQGFRTTDRPTALPRTEDVVMIPADDWRKILDELR